MKPQWIKWHLYIIAIFFQTLDLNNPLPIADLVEILKM